MIFQAMYGAEAAREAHEGCTVSDCRGNEIRRFLDHVYDGELWVTKCRQAPSLVWRSELAMLKADSPRWALRCHLFEDVNPRMRYLGFANLRPIGDTQNQSFSRIAEAYLTPPMRMLLPPYHLTTLGSYGVYYGVPAFGCTPFAKPHPKFGGLCAQACIFMALTIGTVTLGSRVLGPLEITALANPEKAEFKIAGLRASQILSVLSSSDVGIGGLHESLLVKTASQQRRACEIVRTYLAHGIPVIFCVNYNHLYGERVKHPDHVILLIGFTSPISSATANFVYHDPAKGPYRELTLDSMMAGAYLDGEFDFLVPVPSTVKFSLTRAIQFCEHAEAVAPRPKITQRSCSTYSLLPSGNLYRSYFRNSRIEWPNLTNTDPEGYFKSRVLPNYLWVREFYPDQAAQTRGEFSGLWLLDATMSPARGKLTDPLVGFFLASRKDGYLSIIKPGRSTEPALVQGTKKTLLTGSLQT